MSAASTEIERAESLDAAGRHDDAIDCLARATQAGNLEAKTRLAKRLIVGDRAPLLWKQGAVLMREAVVEGGAEAAALFAVLVAAGIGGAHEWAAALKLLEVAAQRGWRPAAEQLRVLATVGGGRPDLDAWGRVSAAVSLHDAPAVRLHPDFLNATVCAWLIDRSRDRLVRARVYDVDSQSNVVSEKRTNSSAGFDLMATDLVHLMVQRRIAVASGLPIAHMEGATVLHYDVGQEIDNHYDFIDPATPNYAEEVRTRGERVLTFLVYLNESYEGGETEFPRLGVSHKGHRGEGLSFTNALPSGEPDLRSWHAGRPPRSGEKWILSQFIRNRRVLMLMES